MNSIDILYKSHYYIVYMAKCINILMSMYGMYNINKDNKGGETLARNQN